MVAGKMENFPIEIIEKIVKRPELSIQDVVNLSVTCRTFLETIRDNNTIWRTKFFQTWPQLRNKLDNKQLSFYQELQHISELKKRTRAMIATMPEKFYKKVELSESDMEEWYDVVKEKWENLHYLTIDLMMIISKDQQIDSIDVVPLDTPGNLTQKYYAGKVMRFIRQIELARMWRKFIGLPAERQLLEVGAVMAAQWCQPTINLDPEEIFRSLDNIAETIMPGATLKTQAQQLVLNLLEYFELEKINGGPLESVSCVQEVKLVLKRDHPDHPLFKATKRQFELWRAAIRPDNEWCPSDCRQILSAMKEVLFENMGFVGYCHGEGRFNTPDENDTYINVVLITRRGMAITLAAIYDSVARRLGLRCEPVIFPSHFLLRFCESQSSGADWYYIDVFNCGEIVRRGICPYSAESAAAPRASKQPMATTAQVIASLAKDMEHLARQTYSPSGQVSRLRSTLELIQLVNPKDVSALINLARLYMLHNFNTGPLETFLLSHEFDFPARVESLLQKLRNFSPDPPDGSIEPVRRPAHVKFAVGMVMYHLLFQYKCVIFNWDPICLAAEDWQWMNNIKNLRYQSNQPFYNVLAEDGSHRYVAQENLYPIVEPVTLLLNDEVGKHFSHHYQTHYVPNAQTDYHYPEDRAVRRRYYDEYLKLSNR